MRHLNKLATTFCAAVLALLLLTGCEGSELYSIGAPDWLQEKIDSIAKNSSGDEYIDITPNPAELGAVDNSTGWWTVFTDDVKIEPGQLYRVKFTNYGGASNYNNFVMILRNGIAPGEEGYYEYGILRSDNWCWNSQYTDGADSDNWCTKKMESSERTWETWLKAMNRADCEAVINNKGDGTCDVDIVMNGSDGKTYKQSYLGIPVTPDDVYLSFTVDGSHIVFGEPVEVEDSEPASIELVGVPKKVMLGADAESTFANLTATVKFENGLASTVGIEDLQLEIIPDLTTLGTKTLVAIFNKTYLGKNCTKPLVARAEFQVVDKMYTIIGKADNTSGFREVSTENFKVGAGETFVSYFTNYTDGVNNWDNFIITLLKGDGTEYCFVRADNWGTGTSYWDGCQSCDWNWDTFKQALDGAKVTTYVTNHGDGTASVKAVVLGSDGVTYTQSYTGLNNIDANDFYFNLSMERAHLEFDKVIGAEDNSSGFRAETTERLTVPAGETYVHHFVNYTDGVSNWNNFIITLNKADGTEYCFVRADNWGTGTSYWDGCQSCDWNWDTFKQALDGAKVTTYVTNHGDGTASVKAVVLGSDGVTYTQSYTGLNNIDAADFGFTLSMEKAHLVFE